VPSLPPEFGSLNLTKYIMPDLDKANAPNDGNAVPESGIPDSAETIEGIDFKVYKIDFKDYMDNNKNLTNAPLDHVFRSLIDDFNKLNFILDVYEDPTKIISADGYEFPVVQVENRAAANGKPAITGFTGTGKNSVLRTDANGKAKADGLEKGFYLVVEQINDKVASFSFPFIVAVPMTDPNGTGWIKDVFVYPKNGNISIEKTIDRNAVHVGEEVNFNVTVSVPADIRTYQEFFMTDTLDEALTYKTGSLKVYGLMADDEAPGTGALIPAVAAPRTNYILTEPIPANDNTLTVAFKKVKGTPAPGKPPAEWNESLEAYNDGFWTLRQYKFVRFEFTCIINDKILDRDGINPDNTHPSGNYPDDPQHWAYTLFNEAEINFKNKFDKNIRRRKSNVVKTHSAALLLEKVDANTQEPLAGAQFKIASSEANARAGKFIRRVQKNIVVNGVTTQTWVLLDPDKNTADWTAAGTAADWVEESKIITAADSAAYAKDPALWAYVQGKAIVRFEGLKEFGNWSAPYNATVPAEDMEDPPTTFSTKYLTYWCVEVKTPSPDYNLLLEPIEVTFTKSNSSFANWYTIKGGIVNNTNKFTLPETGAVGTIIFTAGGAAIMILAVVFYLGSMRKKKSRKTAYAM